MTGHGQIRWMRAITPTLLGMAVVTVGFAALAWHRRWISDDGMIVVRTVRELLAGNGPVYSAFERAEPNTSTLWTYVLALVGWVSHGSVSYLAVELGWLFAVAGVVVAMDAARRWHRDRGATGPLAPAGVLIALGASPFWDFATSGLETGLGQLWLALAWWLLVTLRPDAGVRRHAVTAAALGLGPLVRPDFGLVAIVFLAAAWWIARPRGRRTAWLAGAALALPLAYEIFRAGYYGALVPLPALTKSATASAWGRGLAYFANFAKPYALWLPFSVLGAVLVIALGRRAIAGRDRAILAAPIVAALVLAAYIVRVGGDFMHARMLLPAAFVALLPAAVLPVGRRMAPALVLLAGWALVVGIRRDDRRSRVSEWWLSDDRLGYRQWTRDPHPIDPELFVAADRPASQAVADAIRDGRRRLLSESSDLDAPLDPALAAPVAYSVGRLGTGGAVVPLDGIVADTLGLASPLGARITVTAPGMPGHEKLLPRAWLLAQFADPAFDSARVPDAAPGVVASARRAMRCGAFAELLASTRAPLTAARFRDNLIGAIRRTLLVIPADPFEAEAAFCGGPVAVRASTSHEADGWSRAHAIDGLRSSVAGGALGYSSQLLRQDDHTEWITVGVAAGQVSRVVLYPAASPGFPIDFRIQVWNGVIWVDRVVRSGHPLPGDVPQAFSWTPADTTDRIRILATRLRQVGSDRVLQLAEIETSP